jgi:hypothetical protein
LKTEQDQVVADWVAQRERRYDGRVVLGDLDRERLEAVAGPGIGPAQ